MIERLALTFLVGAMLGAVLGAIALACRRR